MKRRRYRSRKNSGFYLAAVACLILLVGLWMATMMALMLPTYLNVSRTGHMQDVLNLAESGVHFVVAKLNAAAESKTLSQFDDPMEDGEPVVTDVSQQIGGGAGGATITVSVLNRKPDATLCAHLGVPVPSSEGNAKQENYWRVVTSTARVGLVQKTVRCVLQPMLVWSNLKTQPYFQFVVAGREKMQITGVHGHDQAFRSSQAEYNESDQEPTHEFETNDELANGLSAASEKYSGAHDDSDDTALQKGNPVSIAPCIPAKLAPAAKLHVAGVITGGGNHKYVMQPASDQIANLGNLILEGNDVLEIPPGDYIVNHISVTENAQLRITAMRGDEGNANAVRIFLQGGGGQPNLMQIGGRGIANAGGIPAHLQIWCNATGNIKMVLNRSLYATIYAPGADILLTGNGDFCGALFGKTLIASGNGAFKFDMDLLDCADLKYAGVDQPEDSQGQYRVSEYRVLSWQEL